MLSTLKAGRVRCTFLSARSPVSGRPVSEFIAACVEGPLSLVSAHSRGEWPGRACSSSVVLAEIHGQGGRCVPLVLAAHIQPFSQCVRVTRLGVAALSRLFFDFGDVSAAAELVRTGSGRASQQRLRRN